MQVLCKLLRVYDPLYSTVNLMNYIESDVINYNIYDVVQNFAKIHSDGYNNCTIDKHNTILVACSVTLLTWWVSTKFTVYAW